MIGVSLFFYQRERNTAGDAWALVNLMNIEPVQPSKRRVEMATVVPKLADVLNNSRAEEKLHLCFQEDTPADWFIIHSFRWVSIQNKGKPQGEGDFVVFHPQYGVMVVEVKGGGVEYRSGEWFSASGDGSIVKIKDPEKQASDTKFVLLDLLNKSGLYSYLVCHAVWLPDVNVSSDTKLPPNLPRAILLDKTDMENPTAAIERVFEFWKAKHPNTSSRIAMERMEDVKGILLPHLQLVKPLSMEVEDLEEQYIRLTEEQASVLAGLEMNRRVAVVGRAGTGKTLVACEKGRRDAANGKKVLLLCYNTELAKFLRSCHSDSGINIKTIHGFALDYLREHYPARIVGLGNLSQLTSEDFSYVMNEFCETAGATDQYDTILVDEAQDFEEAWLDALEHFLVRGGAWHVFYDPLQCINHNSAEYRDIFEVRKFFVYPLTKNMRNTDPISRACLHVLNAKVDRAYFKGIAGRRPEIVPHMDDELNVKLRELLAYLLYEEKIDENRITVITLNSLDTTGVTGRTRKMIPHFTTVRKFKGLENDIVIVVDTNLGHLLDPSRQKLLYVAMSRARAHVSVLIELHGKYRNLIMDRLGCSEKNLGDHIIKLIVEG
jgi:hypothetical protein